MSYESKIRPGFTLKQHREAGDILRRHADDLFTLYHMSLEAFGNSSSISQKLSKTLTHVNNLRKELDLKYLEEWERQFPGIKSPYTPYFAERLENGT